MPSTTSPSQVTSHPDIPPFPSPSTFSILPDIYLLIARLNILQSQHQQQLQPGSQQTQAQTQSQSQSRPQQLSHPTPTPSTTTLAGGPTSSNNTQAAASTQSTTHIHHHLPGSTPAAAATPTTTTTTPRHIQTSGPPIDAKELPAHVYPIKQKLVKARAAVSTLPDLDRSVDEQEVEIRQLQREVALLKARLAKLGGIAGGSAVPAPEGSKSGADTAMQGVVDG